ncbi:unnamed protein product [Ranitomeya imitator]|uniref:Uncharacterized protein n=1 Tax=Ranitomeya imitator TaxID=111125 RepID=A0ABN9KUT0_9NEOB|nr:unnamed protein product [Ranitomeya imitator]
MKLVFTVEEDVPERFASAAREKRPAVPEPSASSRSREPLVICMDPERGLSDQRILQSLEIIH